MCQDVHSFDVLDEFCSKCGISLCEYINGSPLFVPHIQPPQRTYGIATILAAGILALENER